MRSEEEIFALLLNYAQMDERIRLVSLEGSRANPTIKDDEFKDFDVAFFVTDMQSFLANDDWLEFLGERLILQKPDEMELYPSQQRNRFAYLMLFEDGNKIDLTLVPINELPAYLKTNDGLLRILLDKDQEIKEEIVATDQHYWITKPTEQKFNDCCNEFWWVSTYVAKGLARKEFLFAQDHLNNNVRPTLLLMMSWKIGTEKGYGFTLGKNYKFIQQYLSIEDWEQFLLTFQGAGYRESWEALLLCQNLFRQQSKKAALAYGYVYPDYDEKVSLYIQDLYASYL
ncbi:aminoglycoside 6-adenylyltransferase [Desemzia sp. RIT804]|uniref:aminoglycoside 6-adenylyltransferase n=1 Tax=Desemzia sp. RIT 804 TaxID=2810209 RepID=UPI00194FE186|nr:aminoglycoside 6-adenylyltransferase [Desemzia sp. RIT 804]MBM6613694.1 aminoglycoside 6-adenylyltransferase [Desemzia sp. RIT 804]